MTSGGKLPSPSVALITIAVALLLSTTVSAGQIHTWTDENGVFHMTDAPPPDSSRSVETYRYRKRPDRDLDAVQQIRAHEKDADRIEQADNRAAEARKRAEEATLRAGEAEAAFQQEQKKTAELIQKATKRKKDALEIEQQQAVAKKAAELATEARRQARAAWKLAEEAAEQADLLRRFIRENR